MIAAFVMLSFVTAALPPPSSALEAELLGDRLLLPAALASVAAPSRNSQTAASNRSFWVAVGAGTGAVAGAGLGWLTQQGAVDPSNTNIGIGLVAGALLGGIIGYAESAPPEAPPPGRPMPTQPSATQPAVHPGEHVVAVLLVGGLVALFSVGILYALVNIPKAAGGAELRAGSQFVPGLHARFTF